MDAAFGLAEVLGLAEDFGLAEVPGLVVVFALVGFFALVAVFDLAGFVIPVDELFFAAVADVRIVDLLPFFVPVDFVLFNELLFFVVPVLDVFLDVWPVAVVFSFDDRVLAVLIFDRVPVPACLPCFTFDMIL